LVSDIKRDNTNSTPSYFTQTGAAYDENTEVKIPTDINVLSSGPKVSKHFGNFGRHFPALHPQKSSQRVRACTAHDGAICSKNRKIVPYHGNSPNTRNSARLRSPSPVMAPGNIVYLQSQNQSQSEISPIIPRRVLHIAQL